MAARRRPRPARRRLPPLLDGRRTGWCRTSSRCSTTTRSSPASTCTPGRSRATPATARSRPGRSTTCCASCGRPRAASRRARTPTPTARRARRSSGRPPRSARSWATTPRCSPRPTASRTRATGRVTRSCRGRATTPSSAERFGLEPAAVGERLAAARRLAAGAACRAAAAGPRRQGAGGLERAGDRRARGCGPGARRGGERRAGRGRRSGTATPPWRPPTRSRRRLLGDDGRLRRSWKDGRATGGRRPRGLRQPRRGPPRAVRGDVRRALVHGRRRRSRTRSSPGSPTRPAGSSTPPTTTSGSWSGPRTSRTTPSRPAARWRATVLLRLAALTGEGRYRTPPSGRSRRSARTSPATRPGSRSGCAPWSSRTPGITEVAIIGDRGDEDVRAAAARRGPRATTRSGSWPCSATPADVGRAAAGRPVRAARPGDGVRVPRLRVPPAGARAGGPGRAAGRVVTGGGHRPPRPGRRARCRRGRSWLAAYRTHPDMDDERRVPRPRPRRAGARRPTSTCWSPSTATAGCSGCVSYVRDHTSAFAEVEQPGEAGFRMLGVAAAARGRGVGGPSSRRASSAHAPRSHGASRSPPRRHGRTRSVSTSASGSACARARLRARSGIRLWAYALSL